MRKLSVDFHGLDDQGNDTFLGTVVLDKGKITTTLKGPLAKNTIEARIPIDGGTKFVTSSSDPLLWIRSLCLQYKSAYLRASKAKTLASNASLDWVEL